MAPASFGRVGARLWISACCLVGAVSLVASLPSIAEADSRPQLIAATPDLKRAVFITEEQLDPGEDDDFERDAYLFRGTEPRIVSSARRLRDARGDVTTVKASRDLKAIGFESFARASARDTDAEKDVYFWNGSRPVVLFPQSKQAMSLLAISANGGCVFVTSKEPLASGDSDDDRDIYRWCDGAVDLIADAPRSRGSTEPFHVDSTGEQSFVLTPDGLVPQDTDGFGDIYRIQDGVPTLVSTGPADNQAGRVGDWGVTASGERVVFETSGSLTADDANGIDDVYEWTDQVIQRTSPDPVGSEPDGDYQFAEPPADDRSLIVYTDISLEAGDGDGNTDLYSLSAGSAELLVGSGSAVFEHASPSRDRVIVRSRARLSQADADRDFDLYAWERDTERFDLVTPGARAPGNVRYFAGANERATRVLFETDQPISPKDRDQNSLDIYLAEGGDVRLLTDEAPGRRYSSAEAEATSDDARAAIVFTYAPLSPVDTDAGGPDLYRVSLGQPPRLLTRPLTP